MSAAAVFSAGRSGGVLAFMLKQGVSAILHEAVQGLGVRLAGAKRAGAASAGSRPSFEAAALPHLDAVYNLARYLCRDPAAAEDIVQEAYLRAFRGWTDFRGGSVRAWLFAIVRNCHLTWREQDRMRQARVISGPVANAAEADEDPVMLVAAEGDPERDLLRRDEDACVRRALAELPEDSREILVLRDIEDCSYREIADVLGLPLGTVMSRLSRARKAFAARWAAFLQESDR
jgi:RNA polymerase sigma-70 factor (ECF subfamily)